MDREQGQGKRKRAEEESTEGASTFSFMSPISTDVCSSQYDVFLSFRGSDTRKAFTDHLYHSLIKAGTVPVCVFKDDNSIPIGEKFGSKILDAITRSKISIPIISENYASSKWCLRELIHIMDCKKRTSHIVLPIFYKVDPSDVRYQKGSFGEAFHSRKKHFDEMDIQEGLQALREVSDLHGWESKKFANGHEGELVEKVVKNILSKLQQDFQLDVTKHLVGIGDHVNKIKNWVDTPATVARMIGIYGMGGIGKTTLAKEIYNQLLNDFVHHSFLADIRETAYRHGIPHLQKQLIKTILQNEPNVWNVDDGISLIKSRFKGKKVLILLDDIDDKNQLDVLARERNWFVAGSLIIVTTRNKAILDQSEFEVDFKYELTELDKVQALLLFNRHAFRMDYPPRDFDGISRDIISTMGGLPLALQVVGSYLYKKTNPKIWEDVRKQLENQPHRDVQKILKISYDALEDGHKQIFLDIVCFFIGEPSDSAMYMWDEFYPNQGIEELKLRCLIKIGDGGEFTVHDQLRDLGRSIFCQGQPLEKCRGPWDYNYEGVPRVVRDPENLQVLHLHETAIEKLPSAIGGLKNLQILNLIQCSSLKGAIPSEIGDLSSLEILDLYATSISDLPESVRNLSSLQTLDLYHCKELQSLPELPSSLTCLSVTCQSLGLPQLLRLIHLEKLNLEVLEDICELSSITSKLCFEKRDKLTSLSLSGRMHLEELSIKNCSSIERLELSQLIHLKRLRIEHCDSLVEIEGRDNLESLEVIFLYECKHLKKFTAYGCGNLVEIQGLDGAKFLGELVLSGCKSMETLPDLRGLEKLRYLGLYHCKKLTQLKGLEMLNLISLDISGCDSLEAIPKLSGVHVYINHKLV